MANMTQDRMELLLGQISEAIATEDHDYAVELTNDLIDEVTDCDNCPAGVNFADAKVQLSTEEACEGDAINAEEIAQDIMDKMTF